MFQKIAAATPLEGLRLLVHYSDGTAREYDLRPLLDACPAFRDLETVPGLFRQVRVDPGGYGVSWTGDLDLSAEEIYVNGQPRG